MKKFKISTLLLLILTLVFFACYPYNDPINTEPDPEPQIETIFNQNEGFFILNKGKAGFENASIDYFKYASNLIEHDVFLKYNSHHIGDELQSMTIKGRFAYFLLQEPGELVIVDLVDFTETHRIPGFKQPRYIQFVNESTAYVSDKEANRIWVVDLTIDEISGSIPIQGWTEEMVLAKEKVYVTVPAREINQADSSIYVIDIFTHQIIDTLKIRMNPFNLKQDIKSPRIWVFYQGDKDDESDWRTDPTIGTIYPDWHSNIGFTSMPYAIPLNKSKLAIDEQGDNLYIMLDTRIYRVKKFNNGSTSYSSAPFINGYYFNYYKSFSEIGVSPVNNEIMVAVDQGANEKGSIYVYDTLGQKINAFETGIHPVHFYFY